MFERIFNRKDKELKRKQAEIMAKVKEATSQGQCVILCESPEGTRIVVLGKPLVLRQAEEVLRSKGA